MSVNRRQFLAIAAAVPFAAAARPLAALPAAATNRRIAGYNPDWLPDARQIERWLRQLHEFGPVRATGTRQARAFEEWLATQVTGLGFTLERDRYRLTSWEADAARDCSISVAEDGGVKKTVEVVAYYPFSRSTRGSDPVSGRVLYVPNGIQIDAAKAFVAQTDPAILTKAIVVIDMPLATPAGSDPARVKYYPQSFPPVLPPQSDRPSPHSQGGRAQMELFEGKCQGLVLCYTDISNDAARHSYLPFGDRHRTLPCLFVGAEGSAYLRSIAGRATLTMRLDATLTPNARADSLAATMKGKTDELIFLTTHTDGPNEVNDNGALGVLALASYWSKMPVERRQRTLFLSLPTGHYAGGAIADKETGSGERAGTRGIIARRPDLLPRTVAFLQLEQMGGMEWVDRDGKYAPTGNVAPERWIPTPECAATMIRMFLAATETEDPRYANSRIVESGASPGEGGTLRAAKVPGIGLMGYPTFFFRADPKGIVDKLNPRVMYYEAAVAAKMMVMMNRLTVDQLNGGAPISDSDLFES